MGTRGRFGFWLPLALLGFLALGSAASVPGGGGWPIDATPHRSTTAVFYGLEMSRAYEQQLLSSGVLYDNGDWPSINSPEYWLFGVSVVFLAVIAWYAHKSERRAAFVLAAVCGVASIVVFSGMMWIAEQAPDVAPTVAGSLLAIGSCAAAWVYFHLGRGKSVLTAVSAATLAIGASGLLATWTSYRADELLMASGLLILAWWERSLLVTGLAAALLLIGALSLPMLTELVVVTALLFGCAFVALARRKTAEP